MAALRAGLAIRGLNPAETLAAIVRAEERGLPMVWSTVGGTNPDAVTLFAAAVAKTSTIGVGTAIVPTYPRHPIALASQAQVLGALGPGRFHLGIGPSHRPTIEGMFGLEMNRPLEHLREYLTVLRGLLWEGSVDFEGKHFKVKAELPAGSEPPKTPLPISALRAGAFRLAGEIADGALSWVCPVPYLVNTAKPALLEGAKAAGRPAPPLIGHVPVAMATDREAVRAAARPQLANYGRLPFYRGMFKDAGYEVNPDNSLPDALLDELVVSGTPDEIAARLHQIQEAGVDELLVMRINVADSKGEDAALIDLLARETAPIVTVDSGPAPTTAAPAAAPRRGPVGGLAPLASSGYRCLFIGTTLTMAGYFAQIVAQGWLIYDLTGSPTWLGIVSFANGIPMLVLALPAGVLVDRLDRRKVLIFAQAMTALVTFLLAGLIVGGLVQPWHVAVLAFLAGSLFVLIIPARQALLPTVVERQALGAAIALNSAGTNFGRVIGPSLAGVAIAAFGVAAAFVVQGIGFLGSLVCAVLLPSHVASSRPRSRSPFQSLLEGIQYVWRDSTVFALMLLQAIPAFLIMPYNQMLPIFARDILNAGPEGLGTLMTVMGIGSVLGSVIVVIMPPQRQSVFLFTSLVGLALLLVAFSLSTSLLLSIGIMALIGVAQSIYLATNNTLVQLAVPDALQGRVMSVYMTTWGLMPLGALPQGILADWFGAPVVLCGVGLLSALIVVLMVIRNPALRQL